MPITSADGYWLDEEKKRCVSYVYASMYSTPKGKKVLTLQSQSPKSPSRFQYQVLSVAVHQTLWCLAGLQVAAREYGGRGPCGSALPVIPESTPLESFPLP